MKYQLVLDTIYITTILVSLYHRHHLLVSYYSQFNYQATPPSKEEGGGDYQPLF